jgi:CRP-like cAMP-binding protein
MEPIRQRLLQFLPFAENEIQAISECLRPVSFKKGELLLKEGEVFRQVLFIKQGLLRVYYLHEGKEIIRQFFFENGFVTEYESFLGQKPSYYFIDAVEDTEALTLSHHDYLMLTDTYVNFLRFAKMFAENVVQHVGARYMSIIRDDAKTRYLQLIKERPKVIQRVPQYMIASYLGITPEALSRIRKEMAEEGKK